MSGHLDEDVQELMNYSERLAALKGELKILRKYDGQTIDFKGLEYFVNIVLAKSELFYTNFIGPL